MQCIINPIFLFFHFNFGCSTDLDNRNTASEFGNTLLQFFLVVVRRRLFDLRANLIDTTADLI